MKTIGIDIGTTTISLVCRSGEICAVRTIQNDSALQTDAGAQADRNLQLFTEAQRVQDPQRIAEIVLEALDVMLSEHPDVCCIGLTGQMHGIVYTDREGKSVSPLYTWQDQQGNVPLPDGKTMVQRIREETGMQAASGQQVKTSFRVASGYGLVTHLCLQSTRRLPADYGCVCTIPDYIGMLLTGRKSPLMHTSMAASLGFYDVRNNCFDRAALEAVSIDTAILPQVTEQIEVLGTFRGIPVMTAIGDNQASFLGSVGLREGVPLINIGTGGQISVMSGRYIEAAGIETRPLIDGSFLCVGASLCGGRAYAILEKFFREYAAAAGCAAGSQSDAGGPNAAGSQYEIMSRLAEEAYETSLIVNTQFQGTRANPEERGSILNISEDNFTPGGLIVGVLQGISRELYDMYSAIQAETGEQGTLPADSESETDDKRAVIIGSGNGLRRNPLLQRIIEKMFDAQLVIPDLEEEAACGAAWVAEHYG